MRNKLSPSTDMTPFRQGDLDGLCGIYVIINCVRFLCPEANSKFLGKLFRVLVQSLEREVDKPLAVLWRGIEQPVLLGLIECCIAYVRKTFGIKLRVKLPRRPLRKAKSVAKIWRGVGKSVSQETRRDPQHRRLHLALDRGLRRDTEDHAPVRLVRSKGAAELLLLGGSQRKAIPSGSQRHRVFRAHLTRKESVVSVKLHFCTERVTVQNLERP